MRKIVRLVVKMNEPSQSTLASLRRRGRLSELVKRRKSGTPTRPMPQKGRLIQKTHRQLAFSTRTPPSRGPRIVPRAQAPRTRAKYLGRWRRGTMSAKIICTEVMMPPPPMPWMTRPVRRMVKSLLMAHTIEPAVKKRTQGRRSSRRPKMSEREARKGWKTAAARR